MYNVVSVVYGIVLGFFFLFIGCYVNVYDISCILDDGWVKFMSLFFVNMYFSIFGGNLLVSVVGIDFLEVVIE